LNLVLGDENSTQIFTYFEKEQRDLVSIPNGCLNAQPDIVAHLVSNPRHIHDIQDYETEVVLQAFSLHEETKEIIVKTEIRTTGDILGISTPLRECRQGG
jgi:hypothetical protein